MRAREPLVGERGESRLSHRSRRLQPPPVHRDSGRRRRGDHEPQVRLGPLDGAAATPEWPTGAPAARSCHRRHGIDQRHGLFPRAGQGFRRLGRGGQSRLVVRGSLAVFPALRAQPRVRRLAVPRDRRPDGRELSDEPQPALRCLQREHGVARLHGAPRFQRAGSERLRLSAGHDLERTPRVDGERVSEARDDAGAISRCSRRRATRRVLLDGKRRRRRRGAGAGRDQTARGRRKEVIVGCRHLPFAALAAALGYRRRAGSEVLGHHAAASSAGRRAAPQGSSGRADCDWRRTIPRRTAIRGRRCRATSRRCFRYLATRKGQFASNLFETNAYIRTLPESDRPDLQLVFQPARRNPRPFPIPLGHGFAIVSVCLYPQEHGAREPVRSGPARRAAHRSQARQRRSRFADAAARLEDGAHDFRARELQAVSCARSVARPRGLVRRAVARAHQSAR